MEPKALQKQNPEDAEVLELCARMKAGDVLPAHIKTKEQALMAAQKGRQLGFSIGDSLQNIYFVHGKFSMSYQLQLAVVRKTKGCDIEVFEVTDDHATVVPFRDGKKYAPVTYTIQDAQRAGLFEKKDIWKKQPKSMLAARAITLATKWYFSDLLFGVTYDPSEFDSKREDARAMDVAGRFITEETDTVK